MVGQDDPCEVLEVRGDAEVQYNLAVGKTLRAESYTYSPVRERYLSIPAVGFRPMKSSFEWSINNGYAAGEVPGSYLILTAPIYLPHGAVIKGYEAHINDASAEQDMEVLGIVQSPLGGVYVMFDSRMSTAGAPGATKLVNNNISTTINNYDYAYLMELRWHVPDPKTDMKFYHITIIYEVTTPAP